MMAIVSGQVKRADLWSNSRADAEIVVVVGAGFEKQFERPLVPVGRGEINRVKPAIVPERSVSTTLEGKYGQKLVVDAESRLFKRA